MGGSGELLDRAGYRIAKSDAAVSWISAVDGHRLAGALTVREAASNLDPGNRHVEVVEGAALEPFAPVEQLGLIGRSTERRASNASG